MSDGLNRVLLLGNLGADAELKALPSGESVMNLRIATTRSWFDKEKKEREERTEWHSVSLWGKRAEALAKFLKKGDRIFVEGELRTRSYEKEGEKRYATDVVAQNILFAGSKSGSRSVPPEVGEVETDTSEMADIPFGGPDDKKSESASANGKSKKADKAEKSASK